MQVGPPRKFSCDAAWLDGPEGAGLLTCPLVAAEGEEEDGDVRLAMAHERLHSQLRKRGSGEPAMSGSPRHPCQDP